MPEKLGGAGSSARAAVAVRMRTNASNATWRVMVSVDILRHGREVNAIGCEARRGAHHESAGIHQEIVDAGCAVRAAAVQRAGGGGGWVCDAASGSGSVLPSDPRRVPAQRDADGAGLCGVRLSRR